MLEYLNYDNLFSNNIIFWFCIFAIILAIIIPRSLSASNKTLFRINISSFVVLLGLLLWINLRINIKNNILVFKVKKKNQEQILFSVENNNILNFISEPFNKKKKFNKESIKEIFYNRFSKYLNNYKFNIEGPLIYKNAYVYYITINTEKNILSGMEKWYNKYKFILLKDLKDYNENKNDYNKTNFNYNDNILPILFNGLNNKFIK